MRLVLSKCHLVTQHDRDHIRPAADKTETKRTGKNFVVAFCESIVQFHFQTAGFDDSDPYSLES